MPPPGSSWSGGSRLTELLRQPQYHPYSVGEQTASIWAGTTGQLDEVPVQDVLRFEREFIDYLKHNTPPILTTIEETLAWDDDTQQALKSAIEAFKPTFQTSEGLPLGSKETEALEADEVGQEQIRKQKRS